jgi:hypothetical protein
MAEMKAKQGRARVGSLRQYRRQSAKNREFRCLADGGFLHRP